MGVAPGRKPGKTARQMANSDDRQPRTRPLHLASPTTMTTTGRNDIGTRRALVQPHLSMPKATMNPTVAIRPV
jgi:hypothetical protein